MSLLSRLWDLIFPEMDDDTCHMPANIPHGKVGEEQCAEHPLEQEEEGFSMTPRGIIVATVIFNEPMAHEDVVARLPEFDPNEVYYVLDELIDSGALVLDGDLIKEGNIFHDSPGNSERLGQEQEANSRPTQSNQEAPQETSEARKAL